MKRARIRFYGELNEYLPLEHRGLEFDWTFHVKRSVKDIIESNRVPHAEVDLVLVNSRSVGFDHVAADGDRISVYPVFESIDLRPILKVRPSPLRVSRFVLDAHLGRLAAYLRLFGFDTVHRNNWDESALTAVSQNEHRILLTRDREVLNSSEVTHGRCISEMNPRLQLLEVLEGFDLRASVRVFSRCLDCNSLLAEQARAELIRQVPPREPGQCSRFWRCPGCGRLYWDGPRHRRMREFVKRVLSHPPA
jgi:uncharacterized protein with PIN domain